MGKAGRKPLPRTCERCGRTDPPSRVRWLVDQGLYRRNGHYLCHRKGCKKKAVGRCKTCGEPIYCRYRRGRPPGYCTEFCRKVAARRRKRKGVEQ